jgi:hypothetical protein
MTTPTGTALLAQREREARDEVLQTMLDGNDTTLEYYGGEEQERRFFADRNRHRAENEAQLDAYRAAVRAALVEEIVAKVEDMGHVAADDQSFFVWQDELIATIRGLAAPTTEEG